MSLSENDKKFISNAVKFFEEPTLFTKSLSLAGNVLEGAMARLPDKAKTAVLNTSRTALEQCLKVAVSSVNDMPPQSVDFAQAAHLNKIKSRYHTAANTVAGGVSGFMGPQAMIVELPLTTTVIMRSIVSTAADFGFDIRHPDVLMECLFVFAVSGPSAKDDGMNSAYLSSRLSYASMIRAASQSLAGQSAKELLATVESRSTPTLVKLIAEIAEIFGIRVSKKLATQMLPLVGAIGGAGINYAFTDFFGKAAHFHFGLKHLENTHTKESIQSFYLSEVARIKQT